MITMHCDPNVEAVGRQLVAAKNDLAVHHRLGDIVGDEFAQLEAQIAILEGRYRWVWFSWLAKQP
jgi:hypothetical protein